MEKNLCQFCTKVFFLFNTHLFNGPFSGTTRVSQYQKGKTNLDFTKVRDSEWPCKSAPCSRPITLPAPHHLVFAAQMLFLPPSQQRQSTEVSGTEGIVFSFKGVYKNQGTVT